MKFRSGFTLVELLIVVLIIAILAAIAVPNYLEFQARAKVSRAMSELRTIATALEAYQSENSDYPPNSDDGLAVIPKNLTTPISYIHRIEMIDPIGNTPGWLPSTQPVVNRAVSDDSGKNERGG